MSDETALEVRVSHVEQKVAVLEEGLSLQLRDIKLAIDGLKEAISADRIEHAKQRVCPQPGLCLELQGQVKELKLECEKLQERVTALTTWKAKIITTLGVLMFIFTMFAPVIRDAVIGLFKP